jgi:glycosyltransferase involved in cell wall biosynthesis
MIPIAFLIDTISCDTAGTQKQLLETIRRLDRDAFQPHLICLRETDWMRRNQLPCSCSILNFNGFLKPTLPMVVQRLRRLVQKYRFQIIHTFFEDSIFVGYLGGMLSRPRPLLLSSRRDMGLGNVNQPWYHRLYKLALPAVNKSFTGIVANSAQIKSYVAKREKTPPSKIAVVYNGIDIASKAGPVPALLQAHTADIWIAMVASLTPVKRHDLLIQAMRILKQSLPMVRVKALLLGDGAEKAKLVKLSQQLNLNEDVVFAGAVDNVADHLHHMHIGVLCSDREGLSNAIMEYMACGLPVVATRVGGNVELVDETNGICVPPDDPEALAKALKRLIEDQALRNRLGQESFTKLSQNYSWPKTMATLENYYRGLVGARDSE